MQVFTLSRLTRNVAAQRRVVIQGFDIPARGLIIAGASLLPALAVTAIFWAFIGELAVVFIPIVELAAFWLIETRTRSGLQLRQYQAFMDKRRSIAGRFVCCGTIIDPLHGVWEDLVSSSIRAKSVPGPHLSPEDDIDAAFAIEPPRQAGRRHATKR